MTIVDLDRYIAAAVSQHGLSAVIAALATCVDGMCHVEIKDGGDGTYLAAVSDELTKLVKDPNA